MRQQLAGAWPALIWWSQWGVTVGFSEDKYVIISPSDLWPDCPPVKGGRGSLCAPSPWWICQVLKAGVLPGGPTAPLPPTPPPAPLALAFLFCLFCSYVFFQQLRSRPLPLDHLLQPPPQSSFPIFPEPFPLEPFFHTTDPFHFSCSSIPQNLLLSKRYSEPESPFLLTHSPKSQMPTLPRPLPNPRNPPFRTALSNLRTSTPIA